MLLPSIQPGDAESVRCPACVGETNRFHPVQHLVWRRKFMDRRRKILVRTFDAGDHRTDAGQNLTEVEAIEFSHQASWLAEVQNAYFPLRFQHAENFAQP